jgi:hypothetical protein
MNVKPEAGRCLVDGTTRESRKYVTGQCWQVGQCFMHNCHHRPSALKKSIASHMKNIYIKNTSAANVSHRGSIRKPTYLHMQGTKKQHIKVHPP